jgi:hypothetical protein
MQLRALCIVVGLSCLAAFGSTLARANVVTADPFSISVTGGYGTNSASSHPLTTQLNCLFGSTGTFPSSGFGGQAVTVTSSEMINEFNYIVDTITISVPNSFLPAGTTAPNGEFYKSIHLHIGDADSGNLALNFSSPVDLVQYSDYWLNNVTGDVPFDVQQTFTEGNTVWTTSSGLTAGGTDISAFDFDTFTVVLTYRNAPEPASLSMLALAALPMMRRRRTSPYAASRGC